MTNDLLSARKDDGWRSLRATSPPLTARVFGQPRSAPRTWSGDAVCVSKQSPQPVREGRRSRQTFASLCLHRLSVEEGRETTLETETHLAASLSWRERSTLQHPFDRRRRRGFRRQRGQPRSWGGKGLAFPLFQLPLPAARRKPPLLFLESLCENAPPKEERPSFVLLKSPCHKSPGRTVADANSLSLLGAET